MWHNEGLDMHEAALALEMMFLQLLRRFANEEGIERLNWSLIDEQSQPCRALKKPVKHEGEMTLHLFTARDEGVTMLFRAALKSSHHAVHVLPEDAGAAGQGIQPLEVVGGVLPGLKEYLPCVRFGEVVQIPAAEDGGLMGFLGADGDAAALREGGGL